MNFFKAVSNYNQERFHSEVLCWLINTNIDFAKSWISDCCENLEINDIQRVNCYSEIKQVDILVAYKLKDDIHWYWIHIENKIKADEGEAPASRVSKLLKGISPSFKYYHAINNRTLSQTEYYYSRVACKIEKSEPFGFNDEDLENDFKSVKLEELSKYWTFIYLRPANSREYTDVILNWNIREIENPWIIKDYNSVSKILERTSVSVTERSVYEKDYLELVKSELIPFTLPSFPHKNRISSKFVDAYLGNQLNIADGILLLDAFNYTSKILSEKLKINESNNLFPLEVRFITDTGNNSGVLMEVFLIIQIQTSSKLTSGKNKMDRVRLGFQYEQNEPKKGKLKYYFAAYDYNNIAISDNKLNRSDLSENGVNGIKTVKDFYRDRVKNFLFETFGNKYLNSLIDLDQNLSFNGNRTKTFCSLSIPMPTYHDLDEFIMIFSSAFEIFYKSSIEDLKNKINQLEREFTHI